MSPIRTSRSLFVFLLALAIAPIASAQMFATGEHWVATWGSAQTPARVPAPAAARATQPAPAAPAAVMNPTAPVIPVAPNVAPPQPNLVQRRYNLPPAATNFNNQTVRMSLRATIGGDSVRVRLFNTVGAPTITIGAAHIALHAKDSAIVAGSDRALTFGGKPSAALYGGQLLISDPVKLTIAPLADVSISLYFPGETGPPTNHLLGLRSTYAASGDVTGAPEIKDPGGVSEAYYFLDGVDVLAPADAAALVTFGDSITDGDQSTPGTEAMWPAILAQRLHANPATAHIAVVNEGISGNRILGDNGSGLSRWMHQALDVPGVKWITVLEGINDINAAMRVTAATPTPGVPDPAPFSADDLISAYQQMIDLAHEHGVKVIGCTITPYGGSSGYKDPGEAIRQAANAWIRAKGHFDAVVDFDAATRDSTDPKRFSSAAESPDLLHPGDAGYKMMANAFDLSLFAAHATATKAASPIMSRSASANAAKKP